MFSGVCSSRSIRTQLFFFYFLHSIHFLVSQPTSHILLLKPCSLPLLPSPLHPVIVLSPCVQCPALTCWGRSCPRGEVSSWRSGRAWAWRGRGAPPGAGSGRRGGSDSAPSGSAPSDSAAAGSNTHIHTHTQTFTHTNIRTQTHKHLYQNQPYIETSPSPCSRIISHHHYHKNQRFIVPNGIEKYSADISDVSLCLGMSLFFHASGLQKA